MLPEKELIRAARAPDQVWLFDWEEERGKQLARAERPQKVLDIDRSTSERFTLVAVAPVATFAPVAPAAPDPSMQVLEICERTNPHQGLELSRRRGVERGGVATHDLLWKLLAVSGIRDG